MTKYHVEFHVHEVHPRRARGRTTTGFKTRKAAEAFVAKLREHGTQAFVVEAHSEKALRAPRLHAPRWVQP